MAFIDDRGIDGGDTTMPSHPLFEEIRLQVHRRGWVQFVHVKERVNQTLALEFWPKNKNEIVKVARAWLYFVSGRLVPNKYFSDAQMDRLKYVYAIMKGFNLNVGDIIRHSFDIMIQGASGGGLGLADVITDLCETYGVPQYSYDMKQGALRNNPPERTKGHDEELPQRIAGPIDPAMQYTHDQLNYFIQRAEHAHATYMAQRSVFDENQVQQLNLFITKMNIKIEDPNYLALVM
uniref:Putative plant transposon protein domain-containing protein n=1 Tax=Cannabis sativa TaxID=3483 RepID=A0A803NPV9_CANSA